MELSQYLSFMKTIYSVAPKGIISKCRKTAREIKQGRCASSAGKWFVDNALIE
jgi:hypothetical protein